MKRILIILLAVIAGVTIAFIDSQPGWDDSGITAGLLVLSSMLLGFFMPKQPWLVALAVGLWIPLAAVFFTHNYVGVIALLFSVIGGYSGMLINRLVRSK